MFSSHYQFKVSSTDWQDARASETQLPSVFGLLSLIYILEAGTLPYL